MNDSVLRISEIYLFHLLMFFSEHEFCVKLSYHVIAICFRTIV